MSHQTMGRVAPTKTSKNENFPVGSWLLPAELRPHVALFYRVVRAADDIADSPDLTPGEKLAGLDAFDAALRGETPVAEACAEAARLGERLAGIGVSVDHARNLLGAFRQDATKLRYDDWEDLLGYCRLSADPVGRFLLDLHGESAAGHAASDALCTALQIINHLQDCKDDYEALDRVYLPLDFFAAEGASVEALSASAASPALRRVLDRTLDGVDALVTRAEELPGHVQRPGMRREAAVIIALAGKLARELRRRDPIAKRVELSAAQKLGCLLRGLLRSVLAARASSRVDPASIAKRSGSSFYWAMRFLPRRKREAMFAVYAFCREVDDIADGPGAPAGKRKALEAWGDEIEALYAGRPGRMISRALLAPVTRFGLRREDFEEILRGVGMDAHGPIRAPAMADLTLYCARVAGAVGLLSVRVFGCTDPGADRFALALGEALQLTNILRDVAEDAATGRLYLPREALEAAGIGEREPAAVIAHPRLPEACAVLAERARERFAEARGLLSRMERRDRAALRPAVIMMAVYDRLLDRLLGEGWRRLDPPVRLPKSEKVLIALRHVVT
jgi:squalene synthase HpnD/squalene synthase HpnC